MRPGNPGSKRLTKSDRDGVAPIARCIIDLPCASKLYVTAVFSALTV